jgi:fibronectin-binding autotransporter adhesin
MRRVIHCSVIACALAGALSSAAHAGTFGVTTNADSGPGSLRDAVETGGNANSNSQADVIFFDTGASGDTIVLLSPLTILLDGTVANRVEFQVDGVNFSTSDLLIGGSGLVAGTSLVLNPVNGGDFLSVSSAISGAGALSKAGAGSLTLSGSNSYSGTTTMNAGLLQLTGGAAIANSGRIELNGGILQLNASETIGSLNGAAGSFVDLGLRTLTTGGDNSSTAYAGDISGASGGTLIKQGTGAFTLSGTNTYNGLTIVSGGELRVQGAGSIGTGDIRLSGGQLTVLTTSAFANPNINFFAGTTGTLAAATGSTLTVSGNFNLGANANAVFGSATEAGTIAIGGGTSAATASIRIAGGTLLAASAGLGTHTANIATTTVDAGAKLDFAGFTGAIRSLQGAGTVNKDAGNLDVSNGNFSGSITGTATLRKTSGVTPSLILSGNNSYTGGTAVDGQTLQVGNGGATGTLGTGAIAIGAAGTLAFNRSNALTVADPVSGAGTLTQMGGGNLVLTGNSAAFTGATNVNAGTLSVNGSLGGAATVNSGGTLGGTGTVGTVSVMSGGVFAPGNSIGTITVNGNLTFASGSIFRVETDAAGNADRINVVGAPGTITVNGGTVDVQAGAGTYQRNTTYTILTSTGATTGQFSAVTSNLAFLTPSLVYGPNSVLLNLASSATQSYASAAQTGNQANVADYLNGVVANPGSAAGLIQQLDNLTASQARTAFDGLSGSSHAAASQISGAIGRTQSASIMGRAESGGASSSGTAAFRGVKYARLDIESLGMPVAPQVLSDASYQVAQFSGTGMKRAAAGQAGVWGQVLGAGGNTDSNGNGAGSSYRAGGFMGGYDVMLNDQWMLGGAIGYTPTDWDADVNGASRSRGRIETPMAALYARYESGPWQLRLNGGYADHKFKTTRDITIGSATTTASSTHRGQEWSAAAELEYAINAGAWQIRPMAGVRYASLRENGFAESGANGLAVDARRSENTNFMAGARFLLPFADGSGGWEFRAAWSHLFGDNDSPVSARLAGQPATFTVNGTPLKRDALNLGAGVAGTVSKNVQGYADLAYEARGSGQDAYAVTAGLRVSW